VILLGVMKEQNTISSPVPLPAQSFIKTPVIYGVLERTLISGQNRIEALTAFCIWLGIVAIVLCPVAIYE
jgi:hypothetical protein